MSSRLSSVSNLLKGQKMFQVKEAAAKSGDISGLSEIDLQLIALAYQYANSVLYTDDYRMMNVCNLLKIRCEAVATRGITEFWKWIVRCTGCGRVTESTKEMDKLPNCDICGSPQKIKRSKK